MPIRILMPALSPTMTKGTLSKWHKKEGDKILAGDLMLEIETDKATMEVEAVDEGVLGKIVIPDGTHDVAVNAIIGFILEEGETPESIDISADVSSLSVPQPKQEATPAAPAPKAPTPVTVQGTDRVVASPLAKRIALQNNISLSTIQGSGPYGRIIKRDVESLGSQRNKKCFVANGPAFQDAPLTPMRRIIAERLVESKQTVPHFYLTVECSIDALLEARKGLNEGLAEQGKKLTVNDFVIWASAMALQDHPEANASWLGNGQIRYYNRSDISVAVAIEGGLITPIVKNAEQKTIVDISDDVKMLVKKAHEGRLSPEEFQGGSFSVSNLGMYGIQSFNAIINPPQACILAVGAGEARPVVQDGAVKIQTMMTCTLSVDHRVVDGKVAAELLGSIKGYIENPWKMIAKGLI
jgi:pyruvate dehydrogenase E2 component (dihydrolipoamide acetyltransferase)